MQHLLYGDAGITNGCDSDDDSIQGKGGHTVIKKGRGNHPPTTSVVCIEAACALRDNNPATNSQ